MYKEIDEKKLTPTIKRNESTWVERPVVDFINRAGPAFLV